MAAVVGVEQQVSVAADRRVRVLLVDDARSLRDLLRTILELEDDFVVVGEAGDGAEAVRSARLVRPDLVLLDLAMPVMDGLQALPQIRALLPGARIVVFSGFESGTMAQAALCRGADAYVEKGVPVPELVERIRAAALL